MVDVNWGRDDLSWTGRKIGERNSALIENTLVTDDNRHALTNSKVDVSGIKAGFA
jgi:hypothetical protein